MLRAFTILLVAACVTGSLLDEWGGIAKPDMPDDVRANLLKKEHEYRDLELPVDFSNLEPNEEEKKNLTDIAPETLDEVNKLVDQAFVMLSGDKPKTEKEGIAKLGEMKGLILQALELSGFGKSPAHTVYGTFLCHFATNKDETRTGLKFLRSGIIVAPHNASALTAAGNCLWQNERPFDALEMFKKASLQDDNADTGFHYLCSGLKHRIGARAAVECFKDNLAKFPENSEVALNLAVGLVHLGRWEEGIAACEVAREHNLTAAAQIELYTALGQAHLYLRNFDAAINAFTDLTKVNTKRSDSHALLVEAYQLSGNNEAAALQLKRALSNGKWPRHDQRPAGFLPGLTARPFHDPKKKMLAKYAAPFLSNMTILKEEVRKAVDSGAFFSHNTPLVQTGEIKVLPLWYRSQVNVTACNNFDTVCAVVRATNDSFIDLNFGVSAFVALYEPNTRVMPTFADHNMAVRLDVALMAPEAPMLRVANDTKPLTEGEIVFLDASFEHELTTGSARTAILSVEFWHPDLDTKKKRQNALKRFDNLKPA